MYQQVQFHLHCFSHAYIIPPFIKNVLADTPLLESVVGDKSSTDADYPLGRAVEPRTVPIHQTNHDNIYQKIQYRLKEISLNVSGRALRGFGSSEY